MKRIVYLTRGRGGSSDLVWNPGDERTVKDDVAAGLQKIGVAKIIGKVAQEPTKEPVVEKAELPREEVETTDYRPRRERKPQDRT